MSEFNNLRIGSRLTRSLPMAHTRLVETWERKILTGLNAAWPNLLRTLQHFPQLGIAGGYVRDDLTDKVYNDIDLWVSGGDGPGGSGDNLAWEILSWMDAEGMLHGALPPRDSAAHRPGVLYNATLQSKIPGVHIPIQMVYGQYFYSAEMLTKLMDFTTSQAAVWWQRTAVGDGRDRDEAGFLCSYCTPEFNQDIISKTIRYNYKHHAYVIGGNKGSIRRAFNLASKGYKLDPESMAHLFAKGVERIKDGSVAGSKSNFGHLFDPTNWQPWLDLLNEPEEYRPGFGRPGTRERIEWALSNDPLPELGAIDVGGGD